MVILIGASAGVIVAAALYTLFERERRDVSFTAVSPALKVLNQRDLSGWDSRALGPIPRGPSQLFNQGPAIAIHATRSGEGTSFRWGEAQAGATYTLRFRARAEAAGHAVSYAIGDSAQTAEGPRSSGKAGPALAHVLIRLASAPAISARHVLHMAAGWTVHLCAERRQGDRSWSRPNFAPHRFARASQGSLYERLRSNATREERRYVQSRLDAAHLALRAFTSEPLRGIGWGTFPSYAATHLHFGSLRRMMSISPSQRNLGSSASCSWAC